MASVRSLKAGLPMFARLTPSSHLQQLETGDRTYPKGIDMDEDGTSVAADASLLNVDRREAIVIAAGAALTAGLSVPAEAQASAASTVPLSFTINGREEVASVDPRTSLLDLLRERLALTGAKKGCDHGQCGACTVHLDGRRVASCLTPAVQVQGRQVLTIEGLAPGDALHPMQQAFIDHDALQCGYCTPGQIMAAVACVREGNATSPERIREYMSGNLCRCGAYVGVVAAIRQAVSQMREG
jgi:xanthine dehydrogenase YagT iron-sulfur-binding subunit